MLNRKSNTVISNGSVGMNRRFPHRVDIAMRNDEIDTALEFGIQRRYVEVKPGGP
jgi:hypothetical protein